MECVEWLMLGGDPPAIVVQLRVGDVSSFPSESRRLSPRWRTEPRGSVGRHVTIATILAQAISALPVPSLHRSVRLVPHLRSAGAI